MNTISFRRLVRLIHPDLNPNIQDPGGKMRDATLHKHNERMLYTLGVQWGVIQGNGQQTSYQQTSYQQQQTSYTVDEYGSVKVGYTVTFKRKNKYFDGIIVDYKRLEKGKYKGFWEIFIMVPKTDEILKALRNTLEGSHKFTVSDHIVDQKTSEQCIQKYHRQKRRNEEYKHYKNEKRKMERESQEEYVKRNFIKPNTRYNDGTKIFVLTKGNWFTLIRTTAKRAYYWDNVKGRETFTTLSNVGGVE